jgi:hypothetical protein
MATIKKSVSFNLCPHIHLYETTGTTTESPTTESNHYELIQHQYAQPTFSLKINIPKNNIEPSIYESTIKYNKSTLSPLFQEVSKNNIQNYTNAFHQSMTPELISSSSSIEKYFTNLNMSD